jgi:excisionase family DNA binding protein
MTHQQEAPGPKDRARTSPLSLRPKEAAQVLSISERLLWEWTRREEVPHVHIGNVVLYPIDGLKRWLTERSKALRRIDVSE